MALQHVSPGVYTKIIDLSEYVQSVPSTIGFIPIICEKGPDNELIFTNAKDFYIDFGEPNIDYVGKQFGQGPYVASAFLEQSDSLYVIRCLPDDAAFANLALTYDSTGPSIGYASLASMNTVNELETQLDGTRFVIFYGAGRGEYYNDFKIEISKHANTQLADVYVLDIYAKQSTLDDAGNPQYEIIASFEVSFDPKKKDTTGESMFIEDVVNRYSRFVKCIADRSLCESLNASQDFSTIFNGTALALDNGSSGSLFNPDGTVNVTTATQILTNAYAGTLPKNTGPNLFVDEVLDTDNYYFSIVLDGGYPTSVKTAGIETLVNTRQDCVGIIDNGDNASPADALTARTTNHTFNNKYLALYECYSLIYDRFTGRDIWVTPVYHMARIIPYTDNVAELWRSPAGFNRATISNVKKLRFSPRIGERDQFYLNQINPIVKFSVGYTVWGQLTTQRRPTAMQDLNIVRLVLYIKRALEQFCKFYIFEQNTQETWAAIATQIKAFLKQIQNRRGLYSFSVNVGANEYEIKAKKIHVNVTLVPVREAEQIELNFFIK